MEMRFTLKGLVRATVRGPDGAVKQVEETPNLVVNTGRTYIRNLIRSKIDVSAVTAMGYMALGTSSTAAAAGQTALQADLGDPAPREALTAADSGSYAVVLSNTWAAGVATYVNIREVGIFDANAAGNMMARAVFGADVNKGAADTLTVDWTITVTAS